MKPDQPLLYFSSYAARRSGNASAAEEILQYALKNGAHFTKVFEQLQRTFHESRQHEKVLELFLKFAELGTISEFIATTTLMSMIELRKYDELVGVVRTLQEAYNIQPSAALYTVIFKGLAQGERHKDILKLLALVPAGPQQRQLLDNRMFTTLLTRLPAYPKFRVEYVNQIMRHQKSTEIAPDAHLLRATLSAYQAINDMASAITIAAALREMPGAESDLATSTALLRFFSVSGQEKAGDDVIKAAFDSQMRLDQRFYATYLEFLARFGRFDEFFERIEEMMNSGLRPEVPMWVRVIREVRNLRRDRGDDSVLLRVVELLRRTKTPPNVYITTSIMQYWLDRNNIKEAIKAMDELSAGSRDQKNGDRQKFVPISMLLVYYASKGSWPDFRIALNTLKTLPVPQYLNYWWVRAALLHCRAASMERDFDALMSYSVTIGGPAFNIPTTAEEARQYLTPTSQRIEETLNASSDEFEVISLLK